MQNFEFEPEELKEFAESSENFLINPPTFEELTNNEYLLSMKNKIDHILNTASEKSKTAKLWVQYIHMVNLLKNFIRSERCGDWELHLECVRNMLPYFHASGHYLYAKSAHLYLQDMILLDKDTHQPLSDYFTVCRTEKYFSGVWSDMIVEQTLMRSIHSVGGLSHGRGMKDHVWNQWILSMPSSAEICNQLEDYTNVFDASSYQHVDWSTARDTKDRADTDILFEWLSMHNPFSVTDKLLSLSNGVVAGKNVNCHDAYKVGTIMLSKLTGMKFSEIKYKRSDIVKTMKAQSSLKVRNVNKLIDPLILFKRISILKKSDDQLKYYVQQFELAPYPLALFNENGMRKTPKSKLYKIFPISSTSLCTTNFVHVIDGGFLLRKIHWE